jgi:hypothetical protein
VFERVGNPLGVFLVGFLAANGFDVFRVGEDDVAREFKGIIQ